MNLIEKTRYPESGRPAFRWLGMKENTKTGLEAALNSNNSKRRVFGTEITNTGSKRFKADSLSNWRSSEKVNAPMHTKQDKLKIEYDENSMKQCPGHNSKDFVFGPFTPANAPSLRVPERGGFRTGSTDFYLSPSIWKPRQQYNCLWQLNDRRCILLTMYESDLLLIMPTLGSHGLLKLLRSKYSQYLDAAPLPSTQDALLRRSKSCLLHIPFLCCLIWMYFLYTPSEMASAYIVT